MPRGEVERVLARWPGVQRAPIGTITGYWGLTITPTRHRIELDGRVLYAWCAWDTLFLPRLLAERANVLSNCPVSGKRITLEVLPHALGRATRHPPVSFIAPEAAGNRRDRGRGEDAPVARARCALTSFTGKRIDMHAFAIPAARPAGLGMLAFGLLLAVYFGLLTLVSGWKFTVEQFGEFWQLR